MRISAGKYQLPLLHINLHLSAIIVGLDVKIEESKDSKIIVQGSLKIRRKNSKENRKRKIIRKKGKSRKLERMNKVRVKIHLEIRPLGLESLKTW